MDVSIYTHTKKGEIVACEKLNTTDKDEVSTESSVRAR